MPRHKLRFTRELMGLKQGQIAKFLGIDASLVSRWEKGSRNPNSEHRKKLAELLRVDDPERLFREGDI